MSQNQNKDIGTEASKKKEEFELLIKKNQGTISPIESYVSGTTPKTARCSFVNGSQNTFQNTKCDVSASFEILPKPKTFRIEDIKENKSGFRNLGSGSISEDSTYRTSFATSKNGELTRNNTTKITYRRTEKNSLGPIEKRAEMFSLSSSKKKPKKDNEDIKFIKRITIDLTGDGGIVSSSKKVKKIASSTHTSVGKSRPGSKNPGKGKKQRKNLINKVETSRRVGTSPNYFHYANYNKNISNSARNLNCKGVISSTQLMKHSNIYRHLTNDK